MHDALCVSAHDTCLILSQPRELRSGGKTALSHHKPLSRAQKRCQFTACLMSLHMQRDPVEGQSILSSFKRRHCSSIEESCWQEQCVFSGSVRKASQQQFPKKTTQWNKTVHIPWLDHTLPSLPVEQTSPTSLSNWSLKREKLQDRGVLSVKMSSKKARNLRNLHTKFLEVNCKRVGPGVCTHVCKR